MKTIHAILVAACFISVNHLTVCNVHAADIDTQQALEIAARFASSVPYATNPSLSAHPGFAPDQSYDPDQSATQQESWQNRSWMQTQPELAYTARSIDSGTDNIFVINLGDERGFVLVSGESRSDATILGWSEHGSFNYENAPIQFKELLASYSAEIDALRNTQGATSATSGIGDTPGSSPAPTWSSTLGMVMVGPLLTTKWNQWAPYNGFCPEGCPTGCFPTALAQIMNYWKWPAESHGQIDGTDFSGHRYDWDNMLDYYGSYTSGNIGNGSAFQSYNGVQADAVARLMADIGTAFHTQYDPTGSPTHAVLTPLVENFGYERDFREHRAPDAAALTSAMREELDLNRPVLYIGNNGGSTIYHALVCDGYTQNGYFHFNYGWGGYCDGYYRQAACASFSQNSYIYTGVRPYDAQETVIGDITYGLLKNGTAEILKYGKSEGSVSTLTIPSTVQDATGNEYKVTRIRKNAFMTKCRFGRITMGDNVSAIEPFAFINCTIDTLVLSDLMETVPDEAFQTTGIKSLTIGYGVKHIGKKAFMTCQLTEVISRSPAFDADDYAFYYTYPDCGGWLDCITSLGEKAFGGASFNGEPHFANLEYVGSQAFAGVTFPSSSFNVPKTLKYLAPDAFKGSTVYSFTVHDDNPWFSASGGILYNKNATSLVLTPIPNMTLGDDAAPFPEGLVRMERGSITSRKSRWATFGIVIPASVEDVSGAFINCDAMGSLTVLAMQPPFATDDSFNDALFEDPYRTLFVPQGCEDLYRNAPGWRRFPQIVGDRQPVATSDPDREWYMIMHRSDSLGNIRIPVSNISEMSIAQTPDSNAFVISTADGTDGAGLKAAVQTIDSVTWMKGFVFDEGQVFDLDPEHLSAVSQLCSVQFGRSAISGDVQLSIRNAVTTPQVVEGVTRGVAVDLSLSNGVHRLKGGAVITIPFAIEEGEQVGAAYFNEETGQWDRVFFIYDNESQAVVITTGHLSLFSVFSIRGKESDSRLSTVYPQYWEYTPLYGFNEATRVLFDIMSSDDPDVEAAMKFKEDMGFWQNVGLDGGYSMLSSLGFTPEAIDNAVEVVGYIGIAMTILDVIAADLKGDDLGVAANTLKSILAFATSQMSSAIGTGVMSASMGITAFIGVALEKFGTMVSQAKLDYGRAMYRYYYSKAGSEVCAPVSSFGNSYLRSATDWYDLFYPAFRKPMTEMQLKAYIEQTVRRYCDRFWEDNNDVYTFCQAEAGRLGFTSYHEISEADQQTISDEYFAELMNGELVSVFQDIRVNIQMECDNRLEKALADFQKQMNTKISLQIVDSSCQEGDSSRYSGWTVRFTEMPAVADPEHWQSTVSGRGKCKLGYFTEYALISNKVRNSLTLVKPDGEEVALYTYQIPEGTGRIIIQIDLATGGQEIDAPHLEDLQLVYDPAMIPTPYTMNGTYAGGTEQHSTTPETFISMDNMMNRNARFQTGLERFFKRHDFITVDKSGHIRIGDDIVGEFPDGGLEGSGTFTISTRDSFQEKTIDSYISSWASMSDDSDIAYLFMNLLDGTVSYDIECQFTVTRTPDDSGYTIVYTGQGSYGIDARVIDSVDGIDYDYWPCPTTFSPDDITTRQIQETGTVRLNYTKVCEVQPHSAI